MEDSAETPEDKQATRSLGLHDLYNAAFSQENGTEFDSIKTEIIYESNKDNEGGPYQLYTIQEGATLNYEYTQTEDNIYNDKGQIILGQYITNDSVLDLDKGIPIHVVKVNEHSNTVNVEQFSRTYPGDTQILQRYLHDSECHKTEKSDESIDYFLIKKDYSNNADQVGLKPETLGIRYEDCDFNSSDSFASTESIIPKKIQCPKCPKKFMFKSDLMKHDKHKHLIKQRLCCKFCNKEFASVQNLIFHEKSHKKKNNNKCDTCNKTFKKSGFLIKHMIKKHDKTMFNCNYCSKAFTSDLMLRNHKKKCHIPEDKLFKCMVCSKVFETKQGLLIHEKCHSVEDNAHICDYCGKTFSKSCYLKNHLKSHTAGKEDDNRVFCDVCGKTFKCESVLAEHSRKHTGEKPFKCETCGKGFAYKSYYKTHLKKHSDVKPFVCEYCQKAFVTSTDLTKHTRTHTQQRPYACSNCNKTFTQQSNLLTHWKRQRCGLKMQEEGTQTSDFELQTVDDKLLAVNFTNQPQNVNIILDQSSFNSEQPILLTALTSLPVIISGTNSDMGSLPS